MPVGETASDRSEQDRAEIAFSAQLATLRSGVHLMALRALRDPDAAEEVAQETLARTVAALRERNPEVVDIGAYVAGIARHVISDVHRAAKHTVPLDASAIPADPRPDCLEALISAAEGVAVRVALASLSRSDREVLRLTFFEGLTPAEIAERLRQPDTRVRKRKARAIERLRRAFFKVAGSHESTSAPTDARGTTTKSGTTKGG